MTRSIMRLVRDVDAVVDTFCAVATIFCGASFIDAIHHEGDITDGEDDIMLE